MPEKKLKSYLKKLNLYKLIKSEPKQKFRRLFIDLETSPNLVFSWRIGRDINLGDENIVHERAIICACFKWEDESKVHFLTWNKGDDKKLVKEFAKVLVEASEIVAHNGDKFDIRWMRARCLKHGISLPPDLVTVDTLKLCRKYFLLNNNKLDYVAKFLGVGSKTETGGFGLWKDIVLNNSKAALSKMVLYCKNDIIILEKVFNKINPFVLSKTHRGVHAGKSNHSCPECSGVHSISNGQRITATGLIRQRLQCVDCGKYWSISVSKNDK